MLKNLIYVGCVLNSIEMSQSVENIFPFNNTLLTSSESTPIGLFCLSVK